MVVDLQDGGVVSHHFHPAILLALTIWTRLRQIPQPLIAYSTPQNETRFGGSHQTNIKVLVSESPTNYTADTSHMQLTMCLVHWTHGSLDHSILDLCIGFAVINLSIGGWQVLWRIFLIRGCDVNKDNW